MRRERQAAYVGQPSRRSLYNTPPHFIFLSCASLSIMFISLLVSHTQLLTPPHVYTPLLDEARNEEGNGQVGA